jgi:hypothetical protein
MTEMRDLLTSWSAYVEEASCIFIRVPKHSRGVLVGDRGAKAPFQRGDPRLKDVPFPTRRPTFKEVQATHARLATIFVGVVKPETPQPTQGGKGNMSVAHSGKSTGEEKEVLGEGEKMEKEQERMEERDGKREGGGKGSTEDLTSVVPVVDSGPASPEHPGASPTASQSQAGKSRKKKKSKKVVQASIPPGERLGGGKWEIRREGGEGKVGD